MSRRFLPCAFLLICVSPSSRLPPYTVLDRPPCHVHGSSSDRDAAHSKVADGHRCVDGDDVERRYTYEDHTPRPIHWLAESPARRNPSASWWMTGFRILPMRGWDESVLEGMNRWLCNCSCQGAAHRFQDPRAPVVLSRGERQEEA